MTKLLMACVMCVATAAVAADTKPTTTPATTTTMNAPAGNMADWKARKVTKEDKKGIDALYTAWMTAEKASDMQAMANLVDFPMYMLTDSHSGKIADTMVNREQWMAMMKPYFENAPKEMTTTRKMERAMFITDAMVVTTEHAKMTMGKMKQDWKSASLVVNKDGKWMFKGMIEGGWADQMTGNMKGATAPMNTGKPATTTTTAAKK